MTEALACRPNDVWFEVHAENYMFDGRALETLEPVRRNSELSLHGVALSLGGVESLDSAHLRRLRSLADRLEPFSISEHLAWSALEGVCLGDLLPLPYNEESLEIVVSHVLQTQDALSRKILVENPSHYVHLTDSTMSESDFLRELVRRSGCGVLCDINNLYVSAQNVGQNALEYLDTMAPPQEIHLGGHSCIARDGIPMLIDDHSSRVPEEVWCLYRRALLRFGPVPTLVEWDNDLPTFAVLLEEAAQVGCRIAELPRRTHAPA